MIQSSHISRHIIEPLAFSSNLSGQLRCRQQRREECSRNAGLFRALLGNKAAKKPRMFVGEGILADGTPVGQVSLESNVIPS